MDTNQQITYSVADGVATITLDRPAQRNGYTMRMAQELRRAFDRADVDDAVRVVVITGAGKDFCVGADLSGGSFDVSGAGEGDLPPLELEPASAVTARMITMTKPVIAALNGAAAGVGATLPLAADFRLAATNSKIGFPFVRRGIAAEGGSSWFLPRLVGLPTALDWLVTGRVFSAQEARDAGLLRSVHAPDELLDAAYGLASEIITHTAPVAVAVARQMLYRASAFDSPEPVFELDTQLVRDLSRSPDAAEGVASFLEKRGPKFPMTVSAGFPRYLPWLSQK